RVYDDDGALGERAKARLREVEQQPRREALAADVFFEVVPRYLKGLPAPGREVDFRIDRQVHVLASILMACRGHSSSQTPQPTHFSGFASTQCASTSPRARGSEMASALAAQKVTQI